MDVSQLRELATTARRRLRFDRQRGLFAIGGAVGVLFAAILVPALADDSPVRVRSESAAEGAGAEQGGLQVGSEPGAVDATGNDGAMSGSGITRGTSGGGAGPVAAGSSTQTPTAGGTGVTSTVTGGGEIKLGVVILDLAAVSRTGLGTATADTTVDETKRYFEHYTEEVNAQGGVHGRKITLHYATFDPLNAPSARRACLALTEDVKVFAVVLPSGFPAESVLCFSEEHRTPTLAFGGEANEWYRRSAGRLFTSSMSGTRNVRSLVRRLHADGTLAGKKIGIVNTDAPTERLPVQEGLLPELRAHGYTVSYHSRISQDTDQQPSQIPVELSQMRRAGVDYILWMTHALVFAQWTQQAAAQGYLPSYALTDIQAGSNDFTVENVPSSTKAIVLTSNRDGEHHAKLPEPARDRDCRTRFERKAGIAIERGTSDYFTVLRACGWLDMFARTARDAGAQPTTESFVAAMQRLSGFEFPWMAPGSAGPGKFDYVDQVRMKRYEGGCRCWMPLEGFRPGVGHGGYGG